MCNQARHNVFVNRPPMNTINLLASLIVFTTIGAPIYFWERFLMTKRLHHGDRGKAFYNSTRILSLLATNMLITVIVLLIFFAILLSVKNEEGLYLWSATQLGILLLFIIFCSFIGYGAGMYITAVTSEVFVLKNIVRTREFKTLDMAHKIFHGPISHVLVFSGAVYAFLTICLMESTIPTAVLAQQTFLMPSYLIVGVLLGIILGAICIRSFTWEHQLPWTMLAFVLLLIFILTKQLDLSVHLFTLMTLFLIAMTNLVFLVEILWANYHGKHYTYARFIPDFIDHDPGEHDV